MRHTRRWWAPAVMAVMAGFGLTSIAQQGPVQTPYPILFVTQVPVPADFTTIGSVFGNHRASLDSVARGGDLWIRYPDGTLKNLTAAAGFGATGFQGGAAIAVREPSVHWSGTRAIFSMVVGGTDRRYVHGDWRWQLYEITGLAAGDTPVITRVPNQPSAYNNVSPIYGTDDRILFTSDRPRGGEAHLYPQLDEYEEAPVVTGIWSLDPASGDLFLVQHSPSGSFSPQVDSFGRVVYIRWDHLQRDQQADADSRASDVYGTYGTFNYADESAGAARLSTRAGVFPEHRSARTDPLAGTKVVGHTFNDFFPWMVAEDGTEEETLNHVGRHEFLGYFDASFNDDRNLVYHHSQMPRANPNTINGFIQIKESPAAPGTYYGIDAPEFSTHASGQIISTYAPPTQNADAMTITYVTHRETSSYTDTPSPNHSGLYRNPLPLSDGSLVAVHTPETRRDVNTGTTANPGSRYDFRLTLLQQAGSVHVADRRLTNGISKSVTYWNPDVLVTYAGPLWELDPVEVRPRQRPPRRTTGPGAQERQILEEQGIALERLQAYLRENDLALIVSHDVTSRDKSDRQQPFNLRVAGGDAQTIGAPGRIYDVAFLQIIQADQIRGVGGTTNPRPGRRVLGQVLHDPRAQNPLLPSAPPGSVAIARDGSVAAFVPARRALSWQLTDAAGVPVVRERLWLTMQPGEVRGCRVVPRRQHAIRRSAGTDAQSRRRCGSPHVLADGTGAMVTGTYTYLAEGVVSSFFDTRISLANPGLQSAATRLDLQRPDGVVVSRTVRVPAMASRTIDARTVPGLGDTAFSAVVSSDVPLAVDRTVSWHDSHGNTYGSHAETGVPAPAPRWYLAEGATHSGFELFYLLQNPSLRPVDVRVRFLRADAPPIEKTYALGPRSRTNIWVNQETFGTDGRLLAAADVSAVLEAIDGTGIIVERAMYLSRAGVTFLAGHESAGVTAPSTRWFLAEGATGNVFDLFLLIANPTEQDADITVTYLLPDGAQVRQVRTVGALQRATIWVDRAAPELAATAVSMVVESTNDVPIVVERSMWWPGGSQTWTEAHNSPGATRTGTAWAVADGEVSGAPLNTATFYLLANPTDMPATVNVTLLFADGGGPVTRTLTVVPNSRSNVSVKDEFPEAMGRRFGALIESVGADPIPIVVERAMYADGAGQQRWAVGSNVLATRLR